MKKEEIITEVKQLDCNAFENLKDQGEYFEVFNNNTPIGYVHKDSNDNFMYTLNRNLYCLNKINYKFKAYKTDELKKAVECLTFLYKKTNDLVFKILEKENMLEKGK